MRVANRTKVSKILGMDWIRDSGIVGPPDEERAITASPNLEPGCVVACFRVNAERRKPLRGPQLDLDLAPARIVGLIVAVVPQHILAAQLLADFCSDVEQV